jgi:hypothetical protein
LRRILSKIHQSIREKKEKMSESNKTYIVCHGEKIVELDRFGMSKEEANQEAQRLMAHGYKNVRVRLEDPLHPSWPLNFDAQ